MRGLNPAARSFAASGESQTPGFQMPWISRTGRASEAEDGVAMDRLGRLRARLASARPSPRAIARERAGGPPQAELQVADLPDRAQLRADPVATGARRE